MFLRGCNRETGLQARDDRSTPQTYTTLWRRKRQTGKASSQPQLHILLIACRALIAKAARHDAHDLISVVVQEQSFADNVRVGSELPPPEPIADHDLQVVAESGIVRIEGAAQLRVYTEDREVIRRNLLEAETQGPSNASEVHVCAGASNRHGLECPGTLEVSPLRNGDADALRPYAGKVILYAN